MGSANTFLTVFGGGAGIASPYLISRLHRQRPQYVYNYTPSLSRLVPHGVCFTAQIVSMHHSSAQSQGSGLRYPCLPPVSPCFMLTMLICYPIYTQVLSGAVSVVQGQNIGANSALRLPTLLRVCSFTRPRLCKFTPLERHQVSFLAFHLKLSKTNKSGFPIPIYF